MSDETTATNDEVEAHIGGTTEDLTEDFVESTLEAQDDEPDVEGHIGGVTETVAADLTENTME
jgi:hypothetical protein